MQRHDGVKRTPKHEYKVQGWPAVIAFLALPLLGLIDVAERMIEVVF